MAISLGIRIFVASIILANIFICNASATPVLPLRPVGPSALFNHCTLPECNILLRAGSFEVEDQLAKMILEYMSRFKTVDPGRSQIFYQNVDWHSAVHAYWAIFRLSNYTGRYIQEAQALASRFTNANLEFELKLVNGANYNDHYGFAWFLLLTVEFDKWARKNGYERPNILRKIGDSIANDFISYYKCPHSTNSRGYLDQGWWLVNLYQYLDYYGDPRLAEIAKYIRDNYLSRPADLRYADTENIKGSFFSTFANWVYLLAKTQPAEVFTNFAGSRLVDEKEIPKMFEPKKDWGTGYNSSYVWSLKAAHESLKFSDSPALVGIDKALAESEARASADYEALVRGDFSWDLHYVPQFIVYGLTEETTH